MTLQRQQGQPAIIFRFLSATGVAWRNGSSKILQLLSAFRAVDNIKTDGIFALYKSRLCAVPVRFFQCSSPERDLNRIISRCRIEQAAPIHRYVVDTARFSCFIYAWRSGSHVH